MQDYRLSSCLRRRKAKHTVRDEIVRGERGEGNIRMSGEQEQWRPGAVLMTQESRQSLLQYQNMRRMNMAIRPSARIIGNTISMHLSIPNSVKRL
jgi:hypothetical protein